MFVEASGAWGLLFGRELRELFQVKIRVIRG